MEFDETFGPILQDIREDIFDSGRYGHFYCSSLLLITRCFSRLLGMSEHDEYERPPAPFVPLGGSGFSGASGASEF